MDCLKWQRPEYAKILSDNSNGKTDYLTKPSEDFARSLIEYLDEENNKLIVETTTSWCFVGEGLRLSMELFGPEYSMFVNTLDPDLKVFFSRKVVGNQGEDLVEKQNAESGSVRRRAHTQNPKNETETQNGKEGDPNQERAPQPLPLPHRFPKEPPR